MALHTDLGLNCALLVDRLSGLRSDAQLPLAADQPQGARPRFAGPMRVDDNAAAGR